MEKTFIDVFLFLDDGFSMAADFDSAYRNSVCIKSDLVKAGWVPHSSKRQWFPLQIIPWIGCIFDFIRGTVLISEEKVKKIIDWAIIILKNVYVAARYLAGLIGLINSTYHAMGDIVYLMTRHSQSVIACATFDTWDVDVCINDEVRNELNFWIANVHILNGKEFFFSPGANKIVYSDASGTGGAAIMEDPLLHLEKVVHCEWDDFQKIQSSTFREMSAILYDLCQFESILRDKVLDWFTDSANTVCIIKRGSMKILLHK